MVIKTVTAWVLVISLRQAFYNCYYGIVPEMNLVGTVVYNSIKQAIRKNISNSIEKSMTCKMLSTFKKTPFNFLIAPSLSLPPSS